MAIFDWSLQTIRRSAGRSAVAAAAYRAGMCLRDERTGLEHDFTRRRGIHSEIVLPPGVEPPEPMRPRSRTEMRARLWNAAEATETRRNSVVAREITMALPHELTAEDRLRLARAFANHVVEVFGVAVDLFIHPPSASGDQRNKHAHLLVTTRRVSHGFVLAKKTRELDVAATGGPLILALRERWAALANAALADAGLDVAIDHRSLAERGIDRAPAQHIGPQATNQARRLRARAEALCAEAEAIEREVATAAQAAVESRTGVPHPHGSPERHWRKAYQRRDGTWVSGSWVGRALAGEEATPEDLRQGDHAEAIAPELQVDLGTSADPVVTPTPRATLGSEHDASLPHIRILEEGPEHGIVRVRTGLSPADEQVMVERAGVDAEQRRVVREAEVARELNTLADRARLTVNVIVEGEHRDTGFGVPNTGAKQDIGSVEVKRAAAQAEADAKATKREAEEQDEECRRRKAREGREAEEDLRKLRKGRRGPRGGGGVER